MVLIATLAIFALALLGMALGLLLSGRPLRGTCGGSAEEACEGRSLSCMVCPNRRR
jgi:hypothetical protein